VKGTRVALSPGGALPRPGRIVVEILPAVTTSAESSEMAASELRDLARESILRDLGEPDMAVPPASAAA
jgi:hypothetical protein